MNRFGPVPARQGVRFHLWAPSADDVALEVEGKGVFPLAPKDGGWKEAVVDCGAGSRYRFRIGGQVMSDPASRRQSGGVHGWSVVCSPLAADPAWRGRPWEEAVLYECHAGLMGGFKGVMEKLPALADLGITAIELMPIAAFPGTRNWGYDGVLPFAPAEAYGSPDDLKALIAAAHAQNLMVFLDVVYNHFGPDGNYLPLYAKPFFRADRPTPWGAAIDFRVKEVREFFAENARHWLFGYGFDGLRFDAVHAIADEGWLDQLAAGLKQEAGSRHIHLVLENEDNIASHLRKGFDAQWNDDIHHALHVLLTGETSGYYRDYAEAPAAKLARGLAQGFIYQGEASSNRKGAPRGEASADLPPSAFVDFLQNHDQTGNRAFGERLTVLAEPGALKAAVALLLLSPHIPMIFMGEEMGSRSPFLYFTDHHGELARLMREGRRREFAAFADSAHGKEIPDPNGLESFTASDPARDAPDADLWRKFYRELLAARKKHVTPLIKGARSAGARAIGDKAVLAQWQNGDERLTIVCNLGSAPIPVPLPDHGLIWGETTDGHVPPFATCAWLAS
ncbi:MAG TPA: malto-oligosyltrehalose trehalohydrolase [Rhizomicrobium sp.]|nr:malto-oligosyltrehalose trehalohydrolase [Rhizomicrobium sp.]